MDVKQMPDGLKALLGRPIAFNRAYKVLTGDTVAALMLSQAVYWTSRTSDKDGWFWKSQVEWEEETGLTRTEQEHGRRILCSLSFFREVRRGVPATMYFMVDIEALVEALSGRTSESVLSPEQIVSEHRVLIRNSSKAGHMRARKEGAKGVFFNYGEVVLRDRARCLLCEKPIVHGPGKRSSDMQFHHRVPLKSGGEHVPSNLACVHGGCHTTESLTYAKSHQERSQSACAKQTGLLTLNRQERLQQADYTPETTAQNTNRDHKRHRLTGDSILSDAAARYSEDAVREAVRLDELALSSEKQFKPDKMLSRSEFWTKCAEHGYTEDELIYGFNALEAGLDADRVKSNPAGYVYWAIQNRRQGVPLERLAEVAQEEPPF